VWKTFEMLCLSKTWSEVVLIHSAHVIKFQVAVPSE